jgi:hypothetical protein
MSSLSSRHDIKRSYDAHMLRVVIELFDEFPALPMIRIIRACQHARACLQVNSSGLVPPSAVGAAARQALRIRMGLTAEVPIWLGYPSTSPPRPNGS